MDFINAFQRMGTEELREQVISLLKEAYTDGRINVESLERRLTEATTADSKDALLALVADIPSPVAGSGKAGTGTVRDENQSWSINDSNTENNQSVFAVLGSSDRKGKWQPARELHCFSLMGSVTLDFREAEFPRRGVTVNAGCLMGSVLIIVPPGINVSMSGLPLLGSIDNKCGSGDNGAPQVTVKGLALLGSVEARCKELKKPKSRRGRSRGRGRQ